MQNQFRFTKLALIAALILSAWAIQFDFNASAHDGKQHAPAAAKKLRNPIAQPTDADIANGKALYEQHCAKCHGKDGKSKTQAAQMLKDKPADLTGHNMHMLTDGELYWITTNGIVKSEMPAMKTKMSERERWQTVVYMRSLTGGMNTAASGSQEVMLHFKGTVGDKQFKCGESYEGIGTTNSKITPTDFRLYVHNVRLLDASGRETPVKLEQDGKWQVDNIVLLDFENGSGPCANGTADTNEVIKGKVAPGNYTGVKFSVGVPFERNHADPAKAPSPLNLTQLFWVWNAGYKFARIEMQTTGLPQGWFLHLGSTGCQPGGTAQTLPTNCNFGNRPEITLTNFNVNSDVVIADLKRLLDGANVDVNQPKTARGCMSAQNDSDCTALFANLGLPFAGKTSSGQQFFVAEKGASTAQLGKMPGARN
ncbi:MAG: MbnP family copper-binding protein [Blastocatellales bacterium]